MVRGVFFTIEELQKYVLKDRKNILRVLRCKGGLESCPDISVDEDWVDFVIDHMDELKDIFAEEKLPVLNRDSIREDKEFKKVNVVEEYDDDEDDEDDDEDEDEDDEDYDDYDYDDDEDEFIRLPKGYRKCETKAYIRRHPNTTLIPCPDDKACKPHPTLPGKHCVPRRSLRRKIVLKRTGDLPGFHKKRNRSVLSRVFGNRNYPQADPEEDEKKDTKKSSVKKSATKKSPAKKSPEKKTLKNKDSKKSPEKKDEDKKTPKTTEKEEFDSFNDKMKRNIQVLRRKIGRKLDKAIRNAEWPHGIWYKNDDSIFKKIIAMYETIEKSDKSYKIKTEEIQKMFDEVQKIVENVISISDPAFHEISIPVGVNEDGSTKWDDSFNSFELHRFYITKEMDEYLVKKEKELSRKF